MEREDSVITVALLRLIIYSFSNCADDNPTKIGDRASLNAKMNLELGTAHQEQPFY